MAINNNLSTATPVNQSKPTITLADLFQLSEGPSAFVGSTGPQLPTLRFPLDLPQYYTDIVISEYERTSWDKVGFTNLQSQILLTLPQQLIDVHSTDYQTTEL